MDEKRDVEKVEVYTPIHSMINFWRGLVGESGAAD